MIEPNETTAGDTATETHHEPHGGAMPHGAADDIAEHGQVPRAEDPKRSARSIGAGPLARALLAPYRVNYHLEHHLLVFVPCWRLPAAHRLLVAKGYGPRMERARGYREVLARATGRGAAG